MQKFFTNDKVFKVVAILGFICAMFYAIDCFVLLPNLLQNSYATAAIMMIVDGVATLGLYISYKKHSKNVMKGLMGVLLCGSFATACALTFPITNTFVLDIVCCFAFLALTLALLINHFIINSDHKSRKTNILVNQCLVIAIAVVGIIWEIAWMPYLQGFGIFFDFTTLLGIVCIAATTVCVESRLDAYRLDREAAGWTEEAGYPENYVHQKDRTK